MEINNIILDTNKKYIFSILNGAGTQKNCDFVKESFVRIGFKKENIQVTGFSFHIIEVKDD